MNDTVFWEIIALFDWDETGDDAGVLEPAVLALSQLEADDIFAFDDLLAEKLYALDTREVCRAGLPRRDRSRRR